MADQRTFLASAILAELASPSALAIETDLIESASIILPPAPRELDGTILLGDVMRHPAELDVPYGNKKSHAPPGVYPGTHGPRFVGEAAS